MNTVTHALLPVVVAGLYVGFYKEEKKRKQLFSTKQIILIGIFGAAPDLLNPHLSLEARYTSWSHGLLCWFLMTLGLVSFSAIARRVCPFYLTGWLSGAYFLHLVCDAVTGGIAWQYPMGQAVIGGYYLSPIWWIPLDVFLLLFAYGLFRVVPNLRRVHSKLDG